MKTIMTHFLINLLVLEIFGSGFIIRIVELMSLNKKVSSELMACIYSLREHINRSMRLPLGRERKAELLEAERLAAVGQTVAGLAHGVKNLITGLEGGMYLLNSGMKIGSLFVLQHSGRRRSRT